MAALFFDFLQLEDTPQRRRDRFLLSKGHAVHVFHACLAELGTIDAAELPESGRSGSRLGGHPTRRAPGVEFATGSLGHALSVGVGIAMAEALDQSPSGTVVMLGDGELQEGQIWEGAMAAGHYQLGNLCAIVDYNKMQSDDFNERTMRLEPLGAKWRAFNWNVRAIDGHDFNEIAAAFAAARAAADKPTVILAHTIKGKGVSYMEGVPSWHGSVTMKPEEIRRALADLGVPPDRQAEYAFHD
jgi:transketolase